MAESRKIMSAEELAKATGTTIERAKRFLDAIKGSEETLWALAKK
jgi:hypothetical protein